MVFISGIVQCKSNADIPDYSVMKLLVYTTPDRQTQPVQLIGEIEFNEPKSFPINYRIELGDRPLDPKINLYLKVIIEKDNVVLFSNEILPALIRESQTSSYTCIFGSQYGDMIAKCGKHRRHLDVYLTHLNDMCTL